MLCLLLASILVASGMSIGYCYAKAEKEEELIKLRGKNKNLSDLAIKLLREREDKVV